MKHVPPGLPGSLVSVEPRYENFIGGKWLAPTLGRYYSQTKNLLVSHGTKTLGLF